MKRPRPHPLAYPPAALRQLLRPISRRRTLAGLGASVGIAALGGCNDDDGTPSQNGTGSSGAATDEASSGTAATEASSGSGDSTSPGLDESGSESTGGPPMSDCTAVSDLPAAELLAPITTLVVVMMENRSFDHYFGALSLVERAAVDGLLGRETNTDLRGGVVPVAPYDGFVVPIEEDPPHGWDASHAQWNRGLNDGFVQQHLLAGSLVPEVVMGYHVREQLPVLYALASNYQLCERWFASVMGPTQPNRFHLHLATSLGLTSNPDVGMGPSGVPSIFDRLDDAGVSNLYYSSNVPFPLAYGRTEGLAPISQFFDDAEAGNLPAFCMVEPALTIDRNAGNDDHPPADIRMGQAFLASVYEALAQSPQWESCMLVITYDEHGGFYDHVSPPTTFEDQYPGFEQLGFRVPSLVVGPYVRRGCVSSVQLDHVSVASTATVKWGLEPLNNRVVNTADLSSAIDPSFLGNPQPPVALPPTVVHVPDTFRIPGARGAMKHQPELSRLLDRGGFPRHLDGRPRHDETMRELLEQGRRLGVVRFA